MKFGFISQWYEPEPAAAAHPSAVARALAAEGHDVRVLTGYPNYPNGRVYSGYKMRLRQREIRDGMEVLRVPLHPSHDSSAFRRSASLSSFALSASMQVGALRDVDAVLVYLSPATVGLPALLLKAIARKPFVLYVQDLWPDSVIASGFLGSSRLAPRIESTLHQMCNLLYQHASSIAVIAPSMREALIERSVSPDKVKLVYNWVDEATFRPHQPAAAVKQQLSEGFWLMYAGGIGDLQGLETAVHAIALLDHRPDIKLALVGHGVAAARLEGLASDLGLQERVKFLGRRDVAQMPGVLAAADAQLVSLRDLPLFRGTIPSKTQATLASGQPLIVSAPGDSSALVGHAQAGFGCEPENPGSLARAIVRMADLSSAQRAEMGRRGRDYYLQHLSSAVGGRLLSDLLGEAAFPGRLDIAGGAK